MARSLDLMSENRMRFARDCQSSPMEFISNCASGKALSLRRAASDSALLRLSSSLSRVLPSGEEDDLIWTFLMISVPGSFEMLSRTAKNRSMLSAFPLRSGSIAVLPESKKTWSETIFRESPPPCYLIYGYSTPCSTGCCNEGKAIRTTRGTLK